MNSKRRKERRKIKRAARQRWRVTSESLSAQTCIWLVEQVVLAKLEAQIYAWKP